MIPAGTSLAQDPAFQGHAAEMQQRDSAQEQRRRALYFDSVDAEFGPQGLPCDHVAASKPHAVEGRGFVVLLVSQSSRPALFRVWFPPGSVSSAETARLTAQKTVAAHLAPDTGIEIRDIQEFFWCR